MASLNIEGHRKSRAERSALSIETGSPTVAHEFPSPPRMKIERLFSAEYPPVFETYLYCRCNTAGCRLAAISNPYLKIIVSHLDRYIEF
jgi:hypothetical protein